MKMNDKFVKAFILIGVMIILLVSVLIFKDKLFENKTVITYIDGCKEVYVDTVLTTPPCDNPYKYPVGNKPYGK